MNRLTANGRLDITLTLYNAVVKSCETSSVMKLPVEVIHAALAAAVRMPSLESFTSILMTADTHDVMPRMEFLLPREWILFMNTFKHHYVVVLLVSAVAVELFAALDRLDVVSALCGVGAVTYLDDNTFLIVAVPSVVRLCNSAHARAARLHHTGCID